jgi:hypothetical protein
MLRAIISRSLLFQPDNHLNLPLQPVRQKKQPYTQAPINRVCDIMPRKAPKEVIEHRITLGDFERKQLVEAVDAYRRDKFAENVPNYIIAASAVGYAGALGLAAWSLYRWLDLDVDVVTAAKSLAMDLDNGFTSWVTGNPMYSATAEANSATTAQEVLDAYLPTIKKYQVMIDNLNSMPDNFPHKALMKRGLNKKKAQMELLMRVKLTQVGGLTDEQWSYVRGSSNYS